MCVAAPTASLARMVTLASAVTLSFRETVASSMDVFMQVVAAFLPFSSIPGPDVAIAIIRLQILEH